MIKSVRKFAKKHSQRTRNKKNETRTITAKHKTTLKSKETLCDRKKKKRFRVTHHSSRRSASICRGSNHISIVLDMIRHTRGSLSSTSIRIKRSHFNERKRVVSAQFWQANFFCDFFNCFFRLRRALTFRLCSTNLETNKQNSNWKKQNKKLYEKKNKISRERSYSARWTASATTSWSLFLIIF